MADKEKSRVVQVDGTTVTVKSPPQSKARPIYYCKSCQKSFPSTMDLQQHQQIDHAS